MQDKFRRRFAMGTLGRNAPPAEFDADGFLLDPQRWDNSLAEQIANEDGIGTLSEAHWAIIQQLRDHYLAYGSIQPESHLCHANDLEPTCISDLFQNMREAWRIAGLPNPGEEAKSYM
jgi:TusE/DsrC/DsvC family sulfur relay protein